MTFIAKFVGRYGVTALFGAMLNHHGYAVASLPFWGWMVPFALLMVMRDYAVSK